ncbi:MAG: hypothetical protein K1X57_07030 [Gemmataceae bacterium]|nr:hypothetical protein [Gemmataceae bacterium]
MLIRQQPPRRAAAALEFVLVFPLLMTLTVTGWWAAHLGFVKLGTLIDAQSQAWTNRVQAEPGTPFDIRQPSLDSQVKVEIRRESTIAPPFKLVGPMVAVTEEINCERTWDATDFPFPRLPERIHPHTLQLVAFAELIPVIARFAPGMAGYAALDPWSNPELVRYVPEGLIFLVGRVQALVTIAGSTPALAAAIGPLAAAEAKAIASLNFGLAAHYADEIRVVVTALRAVPDLIRAGRPE